jgi:hypothetical protein
MPKQTCPNCGQFISDEEALLCHFCGGSLLRAGRGILGRLRYADPRIVWFLLIFFVLAGFILAMKR